MIFFNAISENVYGKLILCNDFNDMIDVCAVNISDFSCVIKSIHDSQLCNLESCQIRSVCERLENYLRKILRRSKRLIRKDLLMISEKYLIG